MSAFSRRVVGATIAIGLWHAAAWLGWRVPNLFAYVLICGLLGGVAAVATAPSQESS